MKQGVWIRLWCVLIVLCPFLSEIKAQDRLFYMQARRLDDPTRTILPSPYIDTVHVAQLIPVEVFIVFENKDGGNYQVSLLYEDPVKLPLFFGTWENQILTSNTKSSVDTLRQIVYLCPQQAGPLEFKVKGMIREKYGQTTAFQAFKIQVNPADSSLIPVLMPDSAEAALGFRAGSSMNLRWKPAESSVRSLSQDVYAFSTEDPTTLLHAARRLYRVSAMGTRSTTFENLVSGQQYGYFARTDYMSEDGPVSIVSQLYLCTQDDTPPPRIAEPIIVPEPGGYRLSWDGVTDDVSGVEKYRIYRASDTGAELVVHTVMSKTDPFFIWLDTDFDPAIKYYYRVRAVDYVGNIGEGARTQVVDAETEFPSAGEINFPDEEKPLDQGVKFVSGTVDTIMLLHPVNLDSIRIIAVRDDRNFFNNPPALEMRVFDSGALTDPLPPHWIFDYAFRGTMTTLPSGQESRGNGMMIDLNFVNGHTYYPVVIYYYRHNKTVIDSLIPRVIDCFDPEDVRNVIAQSIMTGTTGHTQWKMQISWDLPAETNGSPLKKFHIFRKFENETAFTKIDTAAPNHAYYIDESLHDLSGPETVVNPLATYRIVAEDYVGHMRDVNDCAWEATDRALNPPELNYSVRPALETLIKDTLYTHADSVILRFSDFDWTATGQFFVSVNNEERLLLNPQTGLLPVALDTELLTSVIKLRAVYKGGRTSIWSDPIIAVEDSVPPSVLTVRNEPDSSYGYLYLQWNRTSLAADRYDIYRSADGAQFTEVASVSASKDTLTWTDKEALQAYHTYFYKVRPFTKTNRYGEYSNISGDYCNRPPKVFKHSILDRNEGRFEISITWNRGWPIAVSNRFLTDVSIYEDYLDQPLLPGIVSTEPMDTSFVYYDGLLRHNYIFQLRERLDNDSLNRFSGLSLPYTVSLKQLTMEALTQPHKKIYLAWDSLIADTLDVDAFHLIRTMGSQVQLDTLLPPNQFSFMDSDTSLRHNAQYTYRVIALNAFHHVLAANDTTVMCDSGLVYIPTIQTLPAYFNQRSLPICWYWTRDGVPDTTTTRGADKLYLQISTKSGFPETPAGQTAEYEMQAVPDIRCGTFEIPELAGNVNSQVFIRMFAKDKWGNPVPVIYAPVQTAKYDAIPPLQVHSFRVTTIHALDRTQDSVVVQLAWSDSSLADQNELVANVSHYRIIRTWDGQESIVGLWPAVSAQSMYTFLDTVQNQPYSWRLVSVDMAANEKVNGWVQTPVFVSTPDVSSFIPLDFRTCRVQELEDNVNEYFIEIAMFGEHFRLAHTLDDEERDFLLCRSGWRPVSEAIFTCTSGWGSHFSMDTTYFRVKARNGGTWESGWSELKIFYSQLDKGDLSSEIESEKPIPEKFTVSPSYPNPFNSNTSIRYGLPEAGQVTIRIFNCRGALVKVLENRMQTPGYHLSQWTGENQFGSTVASGIYFYEIFMKSESGLIHQRRMKMMLLK